MRVGVTGASGFVGSHTVEALLAAGHAVTVFLRPESDPWRLAGVLHRVEAQRGEPAFTGLEVVLDLGWDGVENRFRNQASQWDNIGRAARLAQRAAEAGVRKWVGLGSQAEYGPRPPGGERPPEPTTAYGAAKLAAHHATRVVCAQAGLGWAWVRLFSSYGPRDNPTWLIPSLALALARGETPALTAAAQQWDFLHVRDAAAALVAVAERGSGVYDLGSGQARPLRAIIERVRDAIDPALPLGFGQIPYRPDQVMHLEADVRRLREIGWEPRVPLDEGLAETAAWFATRAAA